MKREMRLFGWGILAVVILTALCLFSASASAAPIDDLLAQIAALQAQLQGLQGTPTTVQSGNMSQQFDLGDIHGGYSTNMYENNVSLNANIGGQHKIDNVGVSFSPQYWYNYEPDGTYMRTQHGYAISMNLSGRILPLNISDLGSQSNSNSFNARGVNITENTNLDVYQWANNGSNPLEAGAQCYVGISNFAITSANGNYNEWTYTLDTDDPIKPSPVTAFSYNVIWYGDFLPGMGPSGFTPNMSSSVPEPATMSLLALGTMGIIARRKRS